MTQSLFQVASLTLWVVVILGVRGRAQQVEISPLDLNLPDACEVVVQGGEEELESGFGSHDTISLQDVPQSHLPWLNFSRGEFMLHDKPAKNAAGLTRSIQFSTVAMTLSRTAYNYVYLVKGTVSLQANDSLRIEIQVQGALSIKTREFCARGCASPDGPMLGVFLQSVAGSELDPRAIAMEAPEDDCGILVRFRYPKSKTSRTAMISGEIKSLRNPDDPQHFPPIDVAAVYEAEFEYTRMEEVRKLGESLGSVVRYGGRNQSANRSDEQASICESLEDGNRLSIAWNSTCGRNDCSPFKKSKSNDHSVKTRITSLRFQDFECSMDGRVAGQLMFEDADQGLGFQTDTQLVLVAEGLWDSTNSQFLLLACLLDGTDCHIHLTIQVSNLFYTITHPLAIFGHVRSSREPTEPFFFRPFSFFGGGWLSVLSFSDGMSHIMEKYVRPPTLMELIDPLCCQENITAKKWAKYPDGSEFSDLDLRTLVTNPRAAPKAYESNSLSSTQSVFLTAMEIGAARREWKLARRVGFTVDAHRSTGRINVSFNVFVPAMSELFADSRDEWFKRMAGEGWFDRQTGQLCMLGCRSKIWAADGYDDDDNTEGMDCSVLFNVRYPETNPTLWGELAHTTGTITSLRRENDPLRFEPILLDSYYNSSRIQARQALWRKRVDVVISGSTLCLLIIVISLQLTNNKQQQKNQNLPYYSITVLLALVFGHSASLFFSLNVIFLKLSGNRKGDAVEPVSALDATEIISCLASLGALLLEIRWLNLICKARSHHAHGEIGKKASSPRATAEHHIWYICLGMSGFAFMVIQLAFLSGQQILAARYEESEYRRDHLRKMMWSNFQASADVISYFFLLPQVLSRALWDSKNRAPKSLYLYYLYMMLSLVRSLAQFYAGNVYFGPQFGDAQTGDWNGYVDSA